MKKYLNSPEEVIKALKEGSIFESFSSGNTEKIKEIKLINGIIYTNEEVGYCINILSACKYYTEEPEPLKFEVNRAYKTKNGFKAFIFIKTDRGSKILSEDAIYEIDAAGLS